MSYFYLYVILDIFQAARRWDGRIEHAGKKCEPCSKALFSDANGPSIAVPPTKLTLHADPLAGP